MLWLRWSPDTRQTQAIWLLVGDETVILSGEDAADYGDLQTGQIIEVWHDEHFLWSDPPITAARKIVIR